MEFDIEEKTDLNQLIYWYAQIFSDNLSQLRDFEKLDPSDIIQILKRNGRIANWPIFRFKRRLSNFIEHQIQNVFWIAWQ